MRSWQPRSSGALQLFVCLDQEFPRPLRVFMHIVSVVPLGGNDKAVGLKHKTLRLCEVWMPASIDVLYRLCATMMQVQNSAAPSIVLIQ